MSVGDQRYAFVTLRRSLAVIGMLAASCASAVAAEGPSFDGITIIEYASRGDALGSGVDYIVTFVSPRGSYGAAVPISKGSHAGCFSLGVPGSISGPSIGFGIDADLRVRKQRLNTICPVFTLQFEDAATARVDVNTDRGLVSEQRRVVAHIPWRDLDFAVPPFTSHDIKGVKLGPIDSGEDLGPLPAKSLSPSSKPRSKRFQRQVGTRGRNPNNVQGKAAAGEVTGWPSDILYFAQYVEEFEQKSTTEAFEKAVFERYGAPSSVYEKSGYQLWMYDLDGRKVTLEQDDSNSCRATMEFWLKYDPIKRAHGLDWEFNSNDLGPWGCGLVMELNPNRGDGGVSGYATRILSGYVMAVNHFFQRIEEVRDIMEKVEALRSFKPGL